jgi:hypothetical protein
MINVNKDIVIISATSVDKDKFFETKPLGLYISELRYIDFDITFNNKEGLAVVYNRAIAKYAKFDKILVFCHDDVEINENEWRFANKVNTGISLYNVVGLAGTNKITLKKPVLWHIHGNETRRGFVTHCNDGKYSASAYGISPDAVVVIDGLFMAVDCDKVVNSKVKFDEENTSFHFYDIDFCLTAYQNGLSVGVYPIHVTHHSIGEWRNNKDWEVSQEKFLQKWTSKKGN